MITREEIINRSIEVHGEKYDYSLVKDIKNVNDKITYRCIKHNIIHTQTFYNHLKGKGCPECAKEKRKVGRLLTRKEFIEKSSKTHKDLDSYDFEKTDFSKRDEKGNIVLYCKKHGPFSIRTTHFINGVGCQYCNNRQKTDEEVVEELEKLHDTLDFSETMYSKRDELGRVKVICPIHGERLMRYWNLRNGEGCRECEMELAAQKRKLTNEEIIKRAEEIYGEGRFVYDKLDSKARNGYNDKVIITCPVNGHGDFKVGLYNFLYGKTGCPHCRIYKLEEKVKKALEESNISYEFQKNNFDWLRDTKTCPMSLDFYLPEYNIAIECQGEQHFKVIKNWGGEEGYIKRVERDNKKRTLCEKHNVQLIYFLDTKYKVNDNDFSNTKELVKYIKHHSLV